MKKILAILILLLFWFSIVGYFHIFRLLQEEVRHEIKYSLKQGIPEKDLTILSFSHGDRINWVRQGKEFRYEGRMYDVVRQTENDRGVTYYCIDDEKEARLITRMEQLTRDSAQRSSSSSSNSSRILQLIFPTLFVQNSLCMSQAFGPVTLLSFSYKEDILSGYPQLFTPPPVTG
jgi:hypothetical protein